MVITHKHLTLKWVTLIALEPAIAVFQGIKRIEKQARILALNLVTTDVVFTQHFYFIFHYTKA